MGRFERKIKQMNKETEEFDAWFNKNRSRLYDFSEENQLKGYSCGKRIIAIPKKVFVPVIAFISCFIIFLTVTLSIILTKWKNDFNMPFGDESVYTAAMSDDELQKITDKFTFINKMHITAQGELLFREDNSLVFTIIDGELETPEDYYFLKVQIEHNKNYEFGYKTIYRELKNYTIVKDWNINYGQGLNDTNDLYVYFLRMENVDGQVVYMEVHCFENDISYIFNEFI